MEKLAGIYGFVALVSFVLNLLGMERPFRASVGMALLWPMVVAMFLFMAIFDAVEIVFEGKSA